MKSRSGAGSKKSTTDDSKLISTGRGTFPLMYFCRTSRSFEQKTPESAKGLSGTGACTLHQKVRVNKGAIWQWWKWTDSDERIYSISTVWPLDGPATLEDPVLTGVSDMAFPAFPTTTLDNHANYRKEIPSPQLEQGTRERLAETYQQCASDRVSARIANCDGGRRGGK